MEKIYVVARVPLEEYFNTVVKDKELIFQEKIVNAYVHGIATQNPNSIWDDAQNIAMATFTESMVKLLYIVESIDKIKQLHPEATPSIDAILSEVRGVAAEEKAHLERLIEKWKQMSSTSPGVKEALTSAAPFVKLHGAEESEELARELFRALRRIFVDVCDGCLRIQYIIAAPPSARPENI